MSKKIQNKKFVPSELFIFSIRSGKVRHRKRYDFSSSFSGYKLLKACYYALNPQLLSDWNEIVFVKSTRIKLPPAKIVFVYLSHNVSTCMFESRVSVN